jgi:hypothetical protein
LAPWPSRVLVITWQEDSSSSSSRNACESNKRSAHAIVPNVSKLM